MLFKKKISYLLEREIAMSFMYDNKIGYQNGVQLVLCVSFMCRNMIYLRVVLLLSFRK